MSTATLSHRVKQARIEADLTQEDLASRLGVSVSAVQSWEQGQRKQPRPGALTRLANVTGKPLAWFFADEEEAA
jgi:transcriptional regulator with XRE-family HTH domain